VSLRQGARRTRGVLLAGRTNASRRAAKAQSYTLDMSVPEERRAQVLEAGRAKEWFSDWVSKTLANDTDGQDGLALLREKLRRAACSACVRRKEHA